MWEFMFINAGSRRSRPDWHSLTPFGLMSNRLTGSIFKTKHHLLPKEETEVDGATDGQTESLNCCLSLIDGSISLHADCFRWINHVLQRSGTSFWAIYHRCFYLFNNSWKWRFLYRMNLSWGFCSTLFLLKSTLSGLKSNPLNVNNSFNLANVWMLLIWLLSILHHKWMNIWHKTGSITLRTHFPGCNVKQQTCC